jgi:hypothetical protein
MVARVEDAVILAQYLLRVVFGDLAELVVHGCDLAMLVGYRDYCGLV